MQNTGSALFTIQISKWLKQCISPILACTQLLFADDEILEIHENKVNGDSTLRRTQH